MPEENTHTHIEREKTSGSGAGLAFIVGGLVVAVAVIAWAVFSSGPADRSGSADINVSVEDGSGALDSAAGAVESATGEVQDAAESVSDDSQDN